MTTLKNVLEPYLIHKGDNFLSIIRKNTNFVNALKSADGKDKVLTKILDVCEIAGNRYMTAGQLLSTFEYLGVSPDTPIDKFLEFFRTSAEINFDFKKLYKPTPEDLYIEFENKLKEVTMEELASVIRNVPFVDNHTCIRYADAKYYVPVGLDTVKKIISYYHGDEVRYISERRDCDDFAIMFKAFLSKHKLGNLSCCVFWGKFVDEDKNRTVYHAVNLIIYLEGNEYKWKLYEPQSEMKFYEIGKSTEIWDKVKATFVLF